MRSFKRFIRHKIIQIMVLISLCCLGVGCVQPPPSQDPEVRRNQDMIKLCTQLESQGARVMQTGHTLKIIVPSDPLFAPDSANLTSNSSRILDTLARLMIILETTSARVGAYTDAAPGNLRNKALSSGQAQAIEDALWRRGVDARLLYAVGYGNTEQPSHTLPEALAQGSTHRIEIEFQYLPLLDSLVF